MINMVSVMPYLALALECAGIDYELFEKGEFAPQLGASIGLHPHALRILDQLGVQQDIGRAVVPLRDRIHYDEHGRCFEESHVLAEISNILQRPIVFMERSEALKILHDHIQDKLRLHASNGIVGYEETTDGVLVTTQDSTTHHGHILVGADGIHSRMRQLMAERIGKEDPRLAIELVQGFTSEYNCIFGVSNNQKSPFLANGTVHNVYYNQFSAVAAAGVDGLVFWFLFVKAAAVSRTPNCPRFSDVDAEALIEEFDDANEGVLKQWNHNRIVLMGDAVHKATINPGLGGNLATEGIAHFTNILVPLLKAHPMPSFEQLAAAFEEYHARQRPRTDAVVNMSGRITRYEAQETWLYKLAAQYVVPLVSDSVKASAYAKRIKESEEP
ncbi:FAD-dependent oxidoreductase [Aspergillus foveolatus]|uniref:FAD-dependent oxidoreductase n=1 Tax=Aspergillus foveolatus TaxID=210207 RepID=UPI003CCE1AE2